LGIVEPACGLFDFDDQAKAMSNGGVIARKELAVQVIDFFVRSLENEKVPSHYTPIYDYPLEQTLTSLVAL
jgi:hypothetical protein